MSLYGCNNSTWGRKLRRNRCRDGWGWLPLLSYWLARQLSVGWKGALKIKQKNGSKKTIGSLPRTGLNHELWAVGATYGVLKLPSDPPHWSSTGH